MHCLTKIYIQKMDTVAKKAKLKRLKSDDETKAEWVKGTISDINLESGDEGDKLPVHENEEVLLEDYLNRYVSYSVTRYVYVSRENTF